MPSAWKRWGDAPKSIPLMRYGVRFTDIGRMGQSERQKYRDGDEEDRASKRESLTSAPALSERRHCRLARRLVSVCRALDVAVVAAGPHPGAALRPDSIE